MACSIQHEQKYCPWRFKFFGGRVINEGRFIEEDAEVTIRTFNGSRPIGNM